MARYSTGLYTGTPSAASIYYGQSPQLALSIAPFVATALDYRKVRVTWTPPVGDFVRFRLVRNQDGIPETEEDGIILLDLADLSAVSNTHSFTDGVDNVGAAAVALLEGAYAHYAIWLLLNDNTWLLAGTVTELVAAQHVQKLLGEDRTRNTHQKLMDLLPRVFTSTSNSPLDEVDQESDLYNFLYSFSYTLDEMLTFIDLLLPNHLFTNFSKQMLDIRALEYGFTSENRASTRFQRRLVREANYIMARKGTALSIGTLVESMTGYIPTVTPSPNLILTPQDSTFRGSVGAWVSEGAVTLSVDVLTVPPTAESHSLDAGYTGKAVVTVAGAKITNGKSAPVTRGIPVTAGTAYTYSLYAMSDTASNQIALNVNWYDRRGTLLSTSTGTLTTVTTSWAKYSSAITAPTNSVYASIEVLFNQAATYHLDLMQFAVSTVTSYTEANGVRISLEPTKHNLIVNPSFENTTYTTGWSFTGTTAKLSVMSGSVLVGPPGIFTGASFLGLTGGVGGNSASTTATATLSGTFYSFSIYIKSDTDLLGQNLSLSAAKSGLTTLTNSVVVTASSSVWARVHVNLYVPTEYLGATLTAQIASPDNTTHTVYLEAAQLEVGYLPTDFFDGSYAVNGGEWSGTANNSISYMFQNKAVKLQRLKEELPRFLPIGTGYTVESQDGIEFSGWA